MTFLPIQPEETNDNRIIDNPECQVIRDIFLDHYKKVGFQVPWIVYFIVSENDEIIGAGGYKGPPKSDTIEITYGVLKNHQGSGMGTALCKKLIDFALQIDPLIKITARTFPDNKASIRVLEKNGFESIGTVHDDEDGNVLEWRLKK